MLEPLLTAALANALQRGDAALTGPVARGDAGTVAGHVAVLRTVAPDIHPTYLALARATAQRALLSGRLRAAAADPLLELLAHEEPTNRDGQPAVRVDDAGRTCGTLDPGRATRAGRARGRPHPRRARRGAFGARRR